VQTGFYRLNSANLMQNTVYFVSQKWWRRRNNFPIKNNDSSVTVVAKSTLTLRFIHPTVDI
jgi:hypothetical protein